MVESYLSPYKTDGVAVQIRDKNTGSSLSREPLRTATK